jgi:hypothetical protein
MNMEKLFSDIVEGLGRLLRKIAEAIYKTSKKN